jgi:aspartate-semialdehyde dehydrogenase
MMRVGVVGATGQAGSAVVSILEERKFPVDHIAFYASARSAGATIAFHDELIGVRDASAEEFADLDMVLLTAGAAASRTLAPRIAAAGAIVIDNSSAWRADPDVPLVVVEVNPEALDSIPKRIVANPNCTTMVAMPVLKALHDLAGLEAVIVSTYQSVSGSGRDGVAELAAQLERTGTGASGLAVDGRAVDAGAPHRFPRQIAHNVIPLAGTIVDDGSLETDEEHKYRNESRKILGLPGLKVACTCVRVPVFTGHGASITASFARPITVAEATEALQDAAGVELSDIPTPLQATGTDPCYVGRLRATDVVRNGLELFVVGDNLRKGAALNAVQIAELLASR